MRAHVRRAPLVTQGQAHPLLHACSSGAVNAGQCETWATALDDGRDTSTKSVLAWMGLRSRHPNCALTDGGLQCARARPRRDPIGPLSSRRTPDSLSLSGPCLQERVSSRDREIAGERVNSSTRPGGREHEHVQPRKPSLMRDGNRRRLFAGAHALAAQVRYRA